ncbi:hypothetical protein AOLI_G00176360 [Acnodon oligacanthus]
MSNNGSLRVILPTLGPNQLLHMTSVIHANHARHKGICLSTAGHKPIGGSVHKLALSCGSGGCGKVERLTASRISEAHEDLELVEVLPLVLEFES